MISNYGKILLSFVKLLEVPYFFEPSFKIMRKSVNSDRFLLILFLPKLKISEQEFLNEFATLFNLPSDFKDIIAEHITGRREVIVGFDSSKDFPIIKLYIETSIDSLHNNEQPLYRAFKWQIECPENKSIDDYFLKNVESRKDILICIENLFNCEDASALRVTKDLFNLEGGQIGTDKLLYLEVEDQDRSRKSFDIRLYDANLSMRKLMPILLRVADRFSLESEPIEQLLSREKDKTFGHLSSGYDKNGEEFMTFYYGAQQFN